MTNPGSRNSNRQPRPGMGLLLAVLCLSATALSAQWNVTLTIPDPYPSPNVSEWENAPGIVRITIGYTGTGPARVFLKSAVLSAETREEIAGGESESINFRGPATVQRDNRSFLKYRNITYNARYRNQILRTNRLPEGAYDLVVQLMDMSANPPAPVGQPATARFYILSFRRPVLEAPDDSARIWVAFPTFQWSPATTHPGFPVTYRLKICERTGGQTPEQAIGNIPHHEVAVANRTSYVYPNSARSLTAGRNYVWQIQAVDSRNRPLGDFQGRSLVSRFRRDSLFIVQHLQGHFQIIWNVTATTTVNRVGSHYNVKIDIDYPNNATDLGVKVWNQGFQICTDNSNVGEVYSYGDSAKRWVYKVQFSGSYPGGAYQVHYQAVPILANQWPLRRICDSLIVTFKVGTTQYTVRPSLTNARKIISDVYSGACRASRYLVLTCPSRLYAWYDDNQVNSLLNQVGKLAVARNGVVAYVNSGTNQWDLRNWLRPDRIGFGGLLATNFGTPSGYEPNGYVLILGEDNIIGSWIISGFTANWSNSGPTTIVERSDFPWAECDGDNLPEFALGRIVGRSAQELERPIRASLLPQSRSINFPGFMFSGRDGGSASCQASFNNAVTWGSAYLNARGCNVTMTKFSNLANDAARIANVQGNANGKSVILFTGHGNVNNWDCFSGGNVPGLGFDNVHLPLFIGFTCLSGSYGAANSIARACLAKQGTRGFLGAVQVSAVSINSDMTASGFWPGFRGTGRQSAGAGLYRVQFSYGIIWHFLSIHTKLWVWEYNYYGDPW